NWEKLELNQLKARFFEPNILIKQLGISQERPRSTDGLADVPLYPSIKARLEGDLLKVDLTERSGGIGPVTLSVNGKEVIANANPNAATAFQIDLKPLQKYLYRDSDQANTISLRAYNKMAWLKSGPYNIDYKPIAVAEPKPSKPDQSSTSPVDKAAPKMYVISIGTADYSGDQLDLKYADIDAKAMAIALKSVGSQLFNAPEQMDVYCLNTTATSEAELSSKSINWQFAEKEKIAQLFKELSEKTRSNDVVVVYLSGHGISYGSAEKTQFYYLTQGIATDDLSDEAIREKYTISSDELTEWLSTMPALKQVLIIDACNSGTIVKQMTGGTKNLSSGQILALDRMKDRTGMFILSGSAADKVSYEASEFGQGLLTYSLLQGMNGMAIRKTAQASFIDVMNLFQYARDEVPQLAASIDGIQTPMLGFPDQGASFDIGIYNEGVEIPLANKKPTFIRSNFQNELTFDDDLGIGNMIDQQLQAEAGKGAQSNFIFVDLNQKEGAYSIKGRYTKEDGQIKINVRLFSPDGSSEIVEIRPSDAPENIAKMVVRTVKKVLK
ncbi:MAG: caspase family protein, partial [Bacteroidota bacterium]